MNDWQEFVTSLVGSLAWPVAVVVLAALFRKSLGRVLSGDVKRFKAGTAGLEVEFWESVIAEARDELAEERGAAPSAAVASEDVLQSPRDRLIELALVSPRASVVESFRLVEHALRALVVASGVEVDLGRRRTIETATAGTLARIVSSHGLAGEATMDAVRDMSRLRNFAVHGHDDEADISESQALKYVALASEVLLSLEAEVAEVLEQSPEDRA